MQPKFALFGEARKISLYIRSLIFCRFIRFLNLLATGRLGLRNILESGGKNHSRKIHGSSHFSYFLILFTCPFFGCAKISLQTAPVESCLFGQFLGCFAPSGVWRTWAAGSWSSGPWAATWEFFALKVRFFFQMPRMFFEYRELPGWCLSASQILVLAQLVRAHKWSLHQQSVLVVVMAAQHAKSSKNHG